MPDKLALLRCRRLLALANEIGADVGDGALLQLRGDRGAAGAAGRAAYVLEVNAPMVDPPESLKSRLDG